MINLGTLIAKAILFGVKTKEIKEGGVNVEWESTTIALLIALIFLADVIAERILYGST